MTPDCLKQKAIVTYPKTLKSLFGIMFYKLKSGWRKNRTGSSAYDKTAIKHVFE
jgi:hypothetical protein